MELDAEIEPHAPALDAGETGFTVGRIDGQVTTGEWVALWQIDFDRQRPAKLYSPGQDFSATPLHIDFNLRMLAKYS